MLQIKSFVFNDFYENTYVMYDETGSCIIFDPGCQSSSEQQQLKQFIHSNGLTPVRLINTHCHIDHVMGNQYVFENYGLYPEYHANEIPVIESLVQVAQMYQMQVEDSPRAQRFLDVTEPLVFGSTQLQLLFTPGHSPGSVSFYSAQYGLCVVGDVLFQSSIGRTDLPGGNYETLIHSIESQLMTLPDETKVYSGHGDPTTIGYERRNNPFLN